MSSLPKKIIISKADLRCLWELAFVGIEQCRDERIVLLLFTVLPSVDSQRHPQTEDLGRRSGLLRRQGRDAGLHRK